MTSNEANGKRPARLTRRNLLRASGAAALTGLLAACGGAAPAAPSGGTAGEVVAPAANTGAKQTVRYLTWWMEEGNRGKTWTSFIKEFNESQNEVEIKAENIPFDAYTTKTIVSAQSGKLDGDILQTTPELAPRLIKAGLLAPLDDVITTNKITDLSSAHDSLRQDGHLYSTLR